MALNLLLLAQVLSTGILLFWNVKLKKDGMKISKKLFVITWWVKPSTVRFICIEMELFAGYENPKGITKIENPHKSISHNGMSVQYKGTSRSSNIENLQWRILFIRVDRNSISPHFYCGIKPSYWVNIQFRLNCSELF